MWFPQTKAGKYKTCGDACSEAQRQASRESRARACLGCGSKFSPRPVQIANGGGKYCSLKCSIKAASAFANTPAARERIGRTLREGFRNGTIKRPSGPSHVQWTGGKQASRTRGRARATQRVREWRRANPELAREAVSKRRGKLRLHRLPRGTVAAIGLAQRWRCAVCGAGIRRGYHLDHVMPLALGGKHERSNLQLLCPPCNLHKNAKDPIAFMQERGFLL